MGCHGLLQGTFPIQGSSPGVPHCRYILYQLSHRESPTMLEWVAYPLSRGSSEPYNQMGSFELQAYSLPAKQSIFLIVQVFTNIPWIYKYHNGQRNRSKATRQSLRLKVSVKNTKLYSDQSHFCPLLSKITLPSQFFTSDGQNIGGSASASVLPANVQY